MWPFKKEPDGKAEFVYQEPENPFVKRFPIGSEFQYLGVRMCVRSHWDMFMAGYCCVRQPKLTAEYVDAHGLFQRKQFWLGQYGKLDQDNPPVETEDK
jgi:hypothetical protein